jgi:hypothetical protein
MVECKSCGRKGLTAKLTAACAGERRLAMSNGRSGTCRADPEGARMGTGGAEQFDYFMVRVVRSADEPERVAGQVERLGTGEKRAFGTGSQLAQLVASWSDAQPDRDR